jgi:hypothetical protein
MEESDDWAVGGIWEVQNHLYDYKEDLTVLKAIRQRMGTPVYIPAPTNYELLTTDSKIEEMANKHEVIRDALRELEVLIKLHENIDTE